jgi:two-component system phosphate regulon response regulator PhoB
MDKRKLLLIDDDAEFLAELSPALRFHGYELDVCTNSEQAAAKAMQVCPDAILLDIKMGDKSGFKVAQEIRAQPGRAAIPIIGMTGAFKDRGTIKLINQFGFDDCLYKPFFPMDAIAKIEAALAHNGGASGMERDLGEHSDKGAAAGTAPG